MSGESFPFLKGVNFGYLAKADYYGSESAKRAVDRMADVGVEWVSLCVTMMQEAFYSTRLFRDFAWTPSDRHLLRIIEHIHERGMW